MAEEETPQKPTSPRRENRVAAMQFLYAWDLNRPQSLNDAMRLFFETREGGKPRDFYGFAEELIHGTVMKADELDDKIREYAQNWAFHRIAKVDLAILRLALYELLFRKDIPPIVTINEAIDLSKEFSTPDSKRFINGILDRIKENLDRPLRTAAEE